MIVYRTLLIMAFMLLLNACSTQPQDPTPKPQPTLTAVVTEPPEVTQFINTMVTHYQFNQANLTALLNQAHINTGITMLMNKPSESLTWVIYRPLFITPKVIQNGVIFWEQHQKVLSEATQTYGVPPEIIVAILGVETQYGQNRGHYSALDALYTLAFGYPRRAQFFQAELTAYLLLTRKAGFDPLSIKSSYAGALGYPQFMPSTYLQYAIGHQSGHYPDLFNNADDAIMSIAFYLQSNGWQRYGLTAYPLAYAKDLRPTTRKSGELLVLPSTTSVEKWLVFKNFQVIKRYNSSNLYAMAVYQLGRQIEINYKKSSAPDKKNLSFTK